jgi:hypothetical protein
MQRVITCRQILGAIFAASVAVMTLLVAVSGAPVRIHGPLNVLEE